MRTQESENPMMAGSQSHSIDDGSSRRMRSGNKGRGQNQSLNSSSKMSIIGNYGQQPKGTKQ